MSEYVLRIEHKPGVDNIIADVLSRLPFVFGGQTTRGAAIHVEIKSTGEILRRRSNDSKYKIIFQKASEDVLPTLMPSATERRSSSRSAFERNTALKLPVKRSCFRDGNNVSAEGSDPAIPIGYTLTLPSVNISSETAINKSSIQFNSNPINVKNIMEA